MEKFYLLVLKNKYKLQLFKPTQKSFKFINLENFRTKNNFDTYNFFIHLTSILICANVANILSNFITFVSIPTLVLAILVCFLFRLFNDHLCILSLSDEVFSNIGDVALSLFLTSSLMNMDLVGLSTNIHIILFIVFIQLLFIVFYSIFVVFRFMGKDYDSAIMVAGFIGHNLGATPNAIVNMNTITQRYRPSPKALLIVPLTASFLLDAFIVFVFVCVSFADTMAGDDPYLHSSNPVVSPVGQIKCF